MNQGETKSGPEDLRGQVLNAAGLVDYQAGAVVSRTVIKKETGTVTIFAFDEGQGLSEHTAPFDALVQILEGEAEITVSGHAHRVHAATPRAPRARGRQARARLVGMGLSQAGRPW